MDINNRAEIVAYFAEHDIVAEQADRFIRFWQGKHPRSLQDKADKWIAETDQCWHISTRNPSSSPPSSSSPPDASHLIPPSVWYAEHLAEVARREAERDAREGPQIGMPEHMRRHHRNNSSEQL